MSVAEIRERRAVLSDRCPRCGAVGEFFTVRRGVVRCGRCSVEYDFRRWP
ncbi:hypothetical protein [Methanofollis fontis]|nr:hypothetical protein [Methanofollis fontis]